MTVAEVSLEPLGTCSPSIGDLITACVAVLKNQKNVKWDVTAMGTILEGERDQIFSLVQLMDDACFNAGAQRVVTNIRMDERTDKPLHMQDMEQEVESKLGNA